VMMPGIDGFEVLEKLRMVSDVPIIMLTAKQDEIDRLKGFKGGADDYVTKPFSPRELISRIKVFLRRVYDDADQLIVRVGKLSLYSKSMRVESNGKVIDLTASEFKLLYAFMRHKGQILSREQLIELAFGNDYQGIDRNIDSHIKRLRHKIDTDSDAPKYLVTKYGAGYVFGGEYLDNT